MQASSRRLGEFLIDRKVLSRDTLERLIEREQRDGIALSKLLLMEQLVSEKDLVAAIADQVGYPFVDFDTISVNPTLDRMIPEDLARKHLAVAVDMVGAEILVAMEDPSDAALLQAIETSTGFSVRPALAARDELTRVVIAMYGIGDSLVDPGAGMSGGGSVTAGPPPMTELHVNELLERVVELKGSDLHLTAGIPPAVRVDGELRHLTEFPVMNASEIRRMIFAILTQRQRERFEEDLELDTSHAIPNLGRFRVNVFLQRDSLGCVMRTIPYQIVPLEQLGLPDSVKQFAELPRGLVLVTGPTGSGKSTTLASMIDIINTTKAAHIMTVEDPIEFLHEHKTAVVNQREVGQDTKGFAEALKRALRQDPDVILVGEMRDLETMTTAISAAETGHLVFATLHTQDAPQAVDRIIDAFPGGQQQQIRVQLAASLMGVVTQQLLPRSGGSGRAVAVEVLVATPAVRNLIREGKVHQIYSSMQAGGKYGMQTMDQSLAELVKRGTIGMDMALQRCANEEDLRRLIGSGSITR